jgi:hypothetical protein
VLGSIDIAKRDEDNVETARRSENDALLTE